MARIAVFGYASLVSPESAARTLGRPLPREPELAQLPGWRRRWSLARENEKVEKTFARVDGSIPRYVLGLNLESTEGGGIGAFWSHTDQKAPIGANGVLIEVMEDELARLDVREMRYDRMDVTADITSLGAAVPSNSYDQVITYTAKPAHYAPAPPPDAVVLSSYVVAVEAAFAALGEQQLEHYRATTDTPPVEVVEAKLVRDQIPPGNPREW